jgi:hypothetical protein
MTDDVYDNSIERDLAVRDEEGRTVLQVGLFATLYFENGYQTDVRRSVCDCVDEYLAMTGSYIRWVKHPETFHWLPIGSPALPDWKAWLLNLGPNYEWEIKFKGGDDPEAASHFSVGGYGTAAWEKTLSYFKAALPITWFADHEGSFPGVVMSWLRKLRPFHGYGGLGILESPDGAIEVKFEPTVYAMARRFPGLEVDRPASHLNYVEKGIKGVNWLTVLGDHWLSKVGGLDGLRRELDGEFRFYKYPGGLLIQAGQRPQLGDVNRRLWPAEYVKLSLALKPIRITTHRSFHHLGENRFTRETSEEWLRRFDRSSE